jgi:bifunctional non-homologous end joining protein LigD
MSRAARAVAAAPGLPIRQVQLATLVDKAPDGLDWLHEQKFDGYRILADKTAAGVTLFSRRFKDWTAEFPTVAAAIAKLPAKRVVLDGEVAAVLPDGRTSFQALQNAFAGDPSHLVYFVFDLLAVDDEVLTSLPLGQRKERLHALVKRSSVIRYSDHVIGNGAAFFQLACKRGLEGIISKRRDKGYIEGRGTTWVKTKCLLRQELVIGGFTDPEGSRSGIGALLLGYYDGDKLAYAGKVGTGFSMKALADIRRELDPLERTTSPFDPPPARAWTGPCHWVTPKLVAEVAFTEWTDDGRLRHPSFQGMRRDKLAREVVREQPAKAR